MFTWVKMCISLANLRFEHNIWFLICRSKCSTEITKTSYLLRGTTSTLHEEIQFSVIKLERKRFPSTKWTEMDVIIVYMLTGEGMNCEILQNINELSKEI